MHLRTKTVSILAPPNKSRFSVKTDNIAKSFRNHFWSFVLSPKHFPLLNQQKYIQFDFKFHDFSMSLSLIVLKKRHKKSKFSASRKYFRHFSLVFVHFPFATLHSRRRRMCENTFLTENLSHRTYFHRHPSPTLEEEERTTRSSSSNNNT